MIPLVEKYRPRRVQDFCGLTGPRGVLARFSESPYSSSWLFCGDSGTGKTTMAYALAENIGGQIYHIAARGCDLETVRDTCRQCHYMPMFGKWNFVIVDEADQMTSAAQLAFLSILDSTEAPPNTIFFFTANETKRLERRFIGRTRVLEFGLAAEVESAVMHLAMIWRAETTGDAPDLSRMFIESEYNLRDCLMKLEIEIMQPGTYRPQQPTATKPVAEVAPVVPRRISLKRIPATLPERVSTLA